MSSEPLYRVVFRQHDKVCTLYSRFISEENLMGFIELDEITFSDNTSGIVIDTSEEKLKEEFSGVKRCYLPMHSILRIDEVTAVGVSSVVEDSDSTGNVSHFPNMTGRMPQRGE